MDTDRANIRTIEKINTDITPSIFSIHFIIRRFTRYWNVPWRWYTCKLHDLTVQIILNIFTKTSAQSFCFRKSSLNLRIMLWGIWWHIHHHRSYWKKQMFHVCLSNSLLVFILYYLCKIYSSQKCMLTSFNQRSSSSGWQCGADS